jgi:hypothetical protein
MDTCPGSAAENDRCRCGRIEIEVLYDEMAPEAYSRAGIATGIATTLGFVLAVFLTGLE